MCPLGLVAIGMVVGFVAVWVLCAARQRADRERMREWREADPTLISESCQPYVNRDEYVSNRR